MIQFNNQELQVSGKIDADNAQNYYLDGLRVIQSQDKFPVVVNLAGLEQVVLWLWRSGALVAPNSASTRATV